MKQTNFYGVLITFISSIPIITQWDLAMVAHVCNPSDLEGRDWEDYGLRPAQAKSL
jgi:hypothetical protein